MYSSEPCHPIHFLPIFTALHQLFPAALNQPAYPSHVLRVSYFESVLSGVVDEGSLCFVQMGRVLCCPFSELLVIAAWRCSYLEKRKKHKDRLPRGSHQRDGKASLIRYDKSPCPYYSSITDFAAVPVTLILTLFFFSLLLEQRDLYDSELEDSKTRGR